MIFSDFPPSTVNNFCDYSTCIVHSNKVGQLLVDFQLIPIPSLDFQVALNLGETSTLKRIGKGRIFKFLLFPEQFQRASFL